MCIVKMNKSLEFKNKFSSQNENQKREKTAMKEVRK